MNFDHFSEDNGNIAAWMAGHKIAISLAEIACRDKSISPITEQSVFSGMISAYMKNAFADHFLSDRFAGGHIRTLRRTLHEFCINQLKQDTHGVGKALSIFGMSNFVSHTSEEIGIKLGGLLSKCMHDEDNMLGVKVKTPDGKKSWVAYGDGYARATVNVGNSLALRQALLASITEVSDACRSVALNSKTPRVTPGATVLPLLPVADDGDDPLHARNLPMFKLQDGKPMYRTGSPKENKYQDVSCVWAAKDCVLSRAIPKQKEMKRNKQEQAGASPSDWTRSPNSNQHFQSQYPNVRASGHQHGGANVPQRGFNERIQHSNSDFFLHNLCQQCFMFVIGVFVSFASCFMLSYQIITSIRVVVQASHLFHRTIEIP